LTESSAQYATLGVGVMNVLMTFVSLVLVEKAGRKTLLLTGFIGMAISVSFLFVCLLFVVRHPSHPQPPGGGVSGVTEY
jgi:SP family facilitated glucose transporter-like MFS transporter 1